MTITNPRNQKGIDSIRLHCRWEISMDVFHDSAWPMFSTFQMHKEKTLAPSKICIASYECYTKKVLEFDLIEQSLCKKISGFLFKNPILVGHRLYLFIAHGGWLDRNRITLYKKLWKSLPSAWLFNLRLGQEKKIESEKGIRYVGFARIPQDSLLHAFQVLRQHPASALLFTKKDILYDEILLTFLYKYAFPDNRTGGISWANLSLHSCTQENIIARYTGSIDDRIVSLDFIMNDITFKKINRLFLS